MGDLICLRWASAVWWPGGGEALVRGAVSVAARAAGDPALPPAR